MASTGSREPRPHPTLSGGGSSAPGSSRRGRWRPRSTPAPRDPALRSLHATDSAPRGPGARAPRPLDDYRRRARRRHRSRPSTSRSPTRHTCPGSRLRWTRASTSSARSPSRWTPARCAPPTMPRVRLVVCSSRPPGPVAPPYPARRRAGAPGRRRSGRVDRRRVHLRRRAIGQLPPRPIPWRWLPPGRRALRPATGGGLGAGELARREGCTRQVSPPVSTSAPPRACWRRARGRARRCTPRSSSLSTKQLHLVGDQLSVTWGSPAFTSWRARTAELDLTRRCRPLARDLPACDAYDADGQLGVPQHPR